MKGRTSRYMTIKGPKKGQGVKFESPFGPKPKSGKRIKSTGVNR